MTQQRPELRQAMYEAMRRKEAELRYTIETYIQKARDSKRTFLILEDVQEIRAYVKSKTFNSLAYTEALYNGWNEQGIRVSSLAAGKCHVMRGILTLNVFDWSWSSYDEKDTLLYEEYMDGPKKGTSYYWADRVFGPQIDARYVEARFKDESKIEGYLDLHNSIVFRRFFDEQMVVAASQCRSSLLVNSIVEIEKRINRDRFEQGFEKFLVDLIEDGYNLKVDYKNVIQKATIPSLKDANLIWKVSW